MTNSPILLYSTEPFFHATLYELLGATSKHDIFARFSGYLVKSKGYGIARILSCTTCNDKAV
jgi:hypothetical protein